MSFSKNFQGIFWKNIFHFKYGILTYFLNLNMFVFLTFSVQVKLDVLTNTFLQYYIL